MDYDVVIIGGGPVGARAGRDIAKEGYRVLILEEHPEIGEPSHCAGLVSNDVISLAEVEEDVILNRIMGANIYAYDNTRLSFVGNNVYAVVIDRVLFDKRLSCQAKENGAEILLNARATGIARRNNEVEVIFIKDGKEERIKTKLVIGADGAYSSVARWVGLPLPSELIYTFQVEAEFPSDNINQVDVLIDDDVSPGWFSWVIPVSKDIVRIGLGIEKRENPREYFRKLCSKWGVLRGFKDGNIRKIMAGLIPLGLISKSYTDNVMLIGDAAFQLKPLSGGGLYLGLMAADISSKIAIEALRRKNFSESTLSRYHREWRKTIGKEITLGLRLRRLFLNLSNQERSEFLKVLDNPEAKSIILSTGHIDHPWRVMYKLLTSIKAPMMAKLLKVVFTSRG
ncbi:MAG: geranylgeranyl reductase family protein [bacterium]